MRDAKQLVFFGATRRIKAKKLGVGDLLGIAKQLVAVYFGIFPRLVELTAWGFALDYN